MERRLFSFVGTKDSDFIDKFSKSYFNGSVSPFLKIRSALNKGETENRYRFVDDALTYPYIQPNSNFNINYLVFDIDDADVDYFYFEYLNAPIPNFIVETPGKPGAHAWYKLETAVYCQESFRTSKAFRYEEAVYAALCEKLRADRHFSRTLCKNPVSDKFIVSEFRAQPYSLAELAHNLDLNWIETKTKLLVSKRSGPTETAEAFPGATVGTRNSSLFDFCRIQAYSRRSSGKDTNEEAFASWVFNLVDECNSKIEVPLKDREIAEIAASISSWTWGNISPGKKADVYGEEGRHLSIKIRHQKQAEKIQQVRKLLRSSPSLSNRKIAVKLGFSLASVNSYVKAIKTEKEASAAALERKAEREKMKLHSEYLSGVFSEQFVNQFVGNGLAADGQLWLPGMKQQT